MKKIYTLFGVLLLTISLAGQTYLYEDFDNSVFPPQGWAATPQSGEWSSSETSLSGGSAPEAKFSATSGNGTARLWSLAINLSGVDTVILTFNHFYSDKSFIGPSIGVETRANGGSGTWNSVWEVTPNGDTGPEEVQLLLTGGDVGASVFQIGFYVDGTWSNMNAWYIDNVMLKAPGGRDLKMSQILTPGVVTGPEEVQGVVTNVGTTVITEMSLSWQSYTGTVYDSTFTGLSLGLLDTYEFTFDGMWVSAFGYHDLKMWINTVNGTPDEEPGNDTITKSIAYFANILQHIPCYEEFTSSTCPPCASFNTGFVPWCQTNADDIVLVKYQMNWPTTGGFPNGDPYYTPEGGSRRGYYGVTGVPSLFCDGVNIGASVGAAGTALSNALQKTTTIDIASQFTINGNMINVTTNILPFSNIGTKRVYSILIEKVTTGNVATNGETEFHHVMMKMFPDAAGHSVNLQDRDPISLSYSYDLNNTNVEEPDDLLIAVLVQDQSTKEILQSEYGYRDANYSNNANLSQVTLDGQPLEGFAPNVYQYEVWLPSGTVEAPVVNAVPQDNGAFTVINQAFELPGRATIEVYAENLFTTKTYIIDFDILTGIDTKPRPAVQVYPNPANDRLVITGAENARIKIYSVGGKEMISTSNYDGNAIDISSLTPGIYIMHITTSDGYIARKKVVVM